MLLTPHAYKLARLHNPWELGCAMSLGVTSVPELWGALSNFFFAGVEQNPPKIPCSLAILHITVFYLQ